MPTCYFAASPRSKCEGKMREGIKGGSAARSCTGCQWRRRARRRARGGRGKKEQRGKGVPPHATQELPYLKF